MEDQAALKIILQELLQQAPEDEDQLEPWEVDGAAADMVSYEPAQRRRRATNAQLGEAASRLRLIGDHRQLYLRSAF